VDYFNQTLKQLIDHRGRRALDTMQAYAPHLKLEKVFDTANTNAALIGTGITPPPFERYYKRILRSCLLTDWGKEKKLMPYIDQHC
jgi:hypothetical protein